MANNNYDGQYPWFGLLIVAVFILAFISALVGEKAGVSSQPAANNTFEHKYATQRFRQEGYSQQESQQAADAVIKFMQAQEARKR